VQTSFNLVFFSPLFIPACDGVEWKLWQSFAETVESEGRMGLESRRGGMGDANAATHSSKVVHERYSRVGQRTPASHGVAQMEVMMMMVMMMMIAVNMTAG